MDTARLFKELNIFLRNKTGKPQGKAARKLWGVIIPYLQRNPDKATELLQQLALLPRGHELPYYMAQATVIVSRLWTAQVEAMPLNPRVAELTKGVG